MVNKKITRETTETTDKDKILKTRSIVSFQNEVKKLFEKYIGDTNIGSLKEDVAKLQNKMDTFGITDDQVETVQTLLEKLAEAEESEEIATILTALKDKADKSEVYTQSQIDNKLGTKADKTALDILTEKYGDHDNIIGTLQTGLTSVQEQTNDNTNALTQVVFLENLLKDINEGNV